MKKYNNKKNKIILFIIGLCISSYVFAATPNKNKNNDKSQWLNSNIKGNYLSEKPLLKDDFYQSVNYEKLIEPENPQIVNEGNVYNARLTLNTQMLEVLKNGDSTNPEHQILHEFYKQFVNWEQRNSVGLKTVIPYIKKINAVKTLTDFESLFNDEVLCYFMPVYGNFRSSPLLDYTQLFKNKEASYDFYTKMLVKAGMKKSEVENLIKNAIDFEEKIFLIEDDLMKQRYVSYAGIEDTFMNYPIKKYLEALNLPSEFTVYNFNYFINNIERISFIDSLYNQENLENLKTVVLCKLILFASNVTDKESFDLKMEYMKQLNGANNYENDDFTVVNYLNEYFPFMLGKIWMKEYFSDEIKKDAENFIWQIVDEYKIEIQKWKWVSESMKYALLNMLNNAVVVLGPTEGFNDYSKIDINKKTLCESAFAMIKYSKNDYYQKILKSKDPSTSLMAPQEFNAYCNPINLNSVSINVLAGYLCGNNYSPDMKFEEKLGAIGVMMGHEISHIFVTTQNGGTVLAGYWKSDDLAQMQKALKPLIDLMNTKEEIPGKYCDGAFKITEMGADYFGMNIALAIARKTPNFDYDLFFQSYAREHYAKGTPELAEILYKDVHPANFLRANCIVQQFDEFYKTYGIKKGDGMYLAPGKRVKF